MLVPDKVLIEADPSKNKNHIVLQGNFIYYVLVIVIAGLVG